MKTLITIAALLLLVACDTPKPGGVLTTACILAQDLNDIRAQKNEEDYLDALDYLVEEHRLVCEGSDCYWTSDKDRRQAVYELCN
jgi:hypothetical protein